LSPWYKGNHGVCKKRKASVTRKEGYKKDAFVGRMKEHSRNCGRKEKCHISRGGGRHSEGGVGVAQKGSMGRVTEARKKDLEKRKSRELRSSSQKAGGKRCATTVIVVAILKHREGTKKNNACGPQKGRNRSLGKRQPPRYFWGGGGRKSALC